MNERPTPQHRPLGPARSACGRAVEEAYVERCAADAELWAAVSALDAEDGWVLDGARSLQGWLATRLGIGIGHASGLLAAARGASDQPEVLEALACGDLSEPKARLLLEVCTPARHEYVERDLPLLLSQAIALRVTQLRMLLASWTARVDAELEHAAATAEEAAEGAPATTQPEGVDPAAAPAGVDGLSLVPATEHASSEAAAAHALRRFDLGSPCLGSVVFDGVLDTEGELVVRAALEAWMRMDRPTDGPDPRSAAQRRADALVGMCRYVLLTANTPVIGGDRPNVTVLVDLDVLEGRLGGIGITDRDRHLDQAAVRRICCDAEVNRVVMAGAFTLLDVGRSVRTAPLHLRRGVTTRDRHCRFPDCSMPARHTDVHHIVHWANGGHTASHNLMLLCSHHHRAVHEGGWRITGNADDRLTFTHPDGGTHVEPVLRAWRPPPGREPDRAPSPAAGGTRGSSPGRPPHDPPEHHSAA